MVGMPPYLQFEEAHRGTNTEAQQCTAVDGGSTNPWETAPPKKKKRKYQFTYTVFRYLTYNIAVRRLYRMGNRPFYASLILPQRTQESLSIWIVSLFVQTWTNVLKLTS